MLGQLFGRDHRRPVDPLPETPWVDFDDARWGSTVLEEGTAQRPAGVPIAPEDVGFRAGQESLAEERGLEARELLDPIGGSPMGEPTRVLAPGDEATGNHAEAVSGEMESLEEVVVFGPADVSVAQGQERLASETPGGVHDRTLDEELSGDVVRGSNGPEPGLVGAESVSQRRTREESHVAAYAHRTWVLVERFDLGA